MFLHQDGYCPLQRELVPEKWVIIILIRGAIVVGCPCKLCLKVRMHTFASVIGASYKSLASNRDSPSSENVLMIVRGRVASLGLPVG